MLLLSIVTWPLSRWLLRNAGATSDEVAKAWPGDALLDRCDASTTRAVSISAPAHAVWPWLVQIGLCRGGFYSYELLERIGGLDVRNCEEIVPELQSLSVGDPILLHPTEATLWVAELEAADRLCFRTWKNDSELATRDPVILGSWSLYLIATSADSCRLLLRARKQQRGCVSWPRRLLSFAFDEPLDFVMEQRMLRTVSRLSSRRHAEKQREAR